MISRLNWLVLGERNTFFFFHASVINRRRRNIVWGIVLLKNQRWLSISKVVHGSLHHGYGGFTEESIGHP